MKIKNIRELHNSEDYYKKNWVILWDKDTKQVYWRNTWTGEEKSLGVAEKYKEAEKIKDNYLTRGSISNSEEKISLSNINPWGAQEIIKKEFPWSEWGAANKEYIEGDRAIGIRARRAILRSFYPSPAKRFVFFVVLPGYGLRRMGEIEGYDSVKEFGKEQRYNLEEIIKGNQLVYCFSEDGVIEITPDLAEEWLELSEEDDVAYLSKPTHYSARPAVGTKEQLSDAVARTELAGAGTQTAGLSFGGHDGATIRNTTEHYNGTSWSCGFKGEIKTTYQNIVNKFGKPHFNEEDSGDNKVAREWVIDTPDGIATIYNYKDAKNYLGEEGKNPEDITDWHIGGKNNEVAEHIKEALSPIEIEKQPLEEYKIIKEWLDLVKDKHNIKGDIPEKIILKELKKERKKLTNKT